MPRLTATFLAAASALALCAGSFASPALAKPKPKPKYTYTATINCGAGPVVVKSTDDMFAPLLNPVTGHEYQPVAWDVIAKGHRIKERKHARRKTPTAVCTYDDGVAVGTVTVEKHRASR